jgi:zinc protease
MVFAGDVTAEEIYLLAQEYLAGIPAQEPPAPVRTVEPEQQGARRVLVEVVAQTPQLHVAFHAGRAGDADALALDLLLNILVGGDSSRLHRLLVEEQPLAISIGGFPQLGFDPGFVYLYMILPPGGDSDAVEAVLMQALAEIAEQGVSDAELIKARNIKLAEFWRGMATIDGKASALGEFEVFHGSYEKLFALSSEVEQVTNDDIRAVAGRVFRPGNATFGVLQPLVEAAQE